MQCLSEFLTLHGLTLEESPTKYRILKTLKHIPKGSTIITSPSLACFPILSMVNTRCDNCLEIPIESLKRCSRCHKAFYCNVKCQKLAWSAHHKILCPIYKKEENKTLDSDYMDEEMLRRVALRLDKYMKKKSYYEAEKISLIDLNEKINCETFLTLMSHREKRTPEQLEKFKTIAKNVFSDLDLQNITQDELITYLCKFSCNNFNLDDSQLFSFGEGTYPIGSLINHSCRPNAIMMYSIGQQISSGPQILRSIENIKAGEEITISYVDVAMSRTSRQKLLSEKYFFKCQCSRCSSNDVSIDITEEERKVLVNIERLTEIRENGEANEKIIEDLLISQMQQNPTTNDSISSLISNIIISLLPHLAEETLKSDYIQTLEVLFNKIHTTTTHQNLFTTSSLSSATKHFYDRIDLQQWRESWILGRYILAIYLLIYPRFHPIIGLHLFSLAKCMWNDAHKDKDKAVESYEIIKATKKALEITHGDGFENRKIVAQGILDAHTRAK
ncbi:24281_t:CDS:2 [Dentiscutata erythropus]|uniref:24281_t:CDS:1 n=1 Tax=Dentiscutata erythropus TaxID=1348616 RepID=A0A9N8YVC6_9GLOM|nr:24281_t:CDS:2 [Dentiscutata erythropus]